MRIATWNVNSLKMRLPRVEEWLQYAQPDVLCLQETKLADSAFPQLTFSALGYDAVHAIKPGSQPTLEAPCTPEAILNAIQSIGG